MKGRAVIDDAAEGSVRPARATPVGERQGAAPGQAAADGAPAEHDADRRGPRGLGAVEIAAVVALALAVRLVYLDHAPYIDELNHMLAARSLLEDGTLRINDGEPYTRAWLFTYLVAALVGTFGESLVVGRVPAVLAGTALVAAWFVWVRTVAGRAAAWTTALLLCFAPISLYLSQQVRFYTLQTLLFWLSAFAVYRVAGSGTAARPVGRWVLLGAAVAGMAVAFHLQPITAVGAAALAVWFFADRASALGGWLSAGGRARWLGVAAGAIAGVVAVMAFAGSRAAERAWTLFGYADPWAEHDRGNLRFYHDLLVEQYPTAWTLFPLLLLLAVSRFPRPATFLATLFLLPLVFHSLAAWKHERYLFYALPAFFAIVGLAAAVVLPWLRRRVVTALVLLLRRRPSPRLVTTTVTVGLTASVLFVAGGNAAATYSVRMLTVSDADWGLPRAYRGEADWQVARAELAQAAAASDVVIASSMLKALFYLDRVDVGLSATAVARSEGRREFGIVSKEAVPVVSTPESVALIRHCAPSGLLIAEQRNWRQPWGVSPAAADQIEASMARLPLPGSDVLAFRWADAPGAADAAACRAIPRAAIRPTP